MRGSKAKEIRKFVQQELRKRPELINQVLTYGGQIVKPARLAYQRLKGRRMLPYVGQ